VRVGVNSRLDTLQAAILLPKLAVLDEEIALRQQVAARYAQLFLSLRGAAGDAAIQRGGAPDCRLPRFVRR